VSNDMSCRQVENEKSPTSAKKNTLHGTHSKKDLDENEGFTSHKTQPRAGL